MTTMSDEEVTGMDYEDSESVMTSFQIIATAGDARSNAFQALKAAKQGDYQMADELMAKFNEGSVESHNQQTALLTKEAQGDHTPVDVLLVHAQNHLMTSMLAGELIQELIDLHKELDELKTQVSAQAAAQDQ